MATSAASLHASHLHRVPQPAARPRAKVRRDWGRIALQYTPILAVVLLAKIAVPPFGKIGLGIDLPILLAVMLMGLLMGRFRVHVTRLLFYGAILVVLMTYRPHGIFGKPRVEVV